MENDFKHEKNSLLLFHSFARLKISFLSERISERRRKVVHAKHLLKTDNSGMTTKTVDKANLFFHHAKRWLSFGMRKDGLSMARGVLWNMSDLEVDWTNLGQGPRLFEECLAVVLNKVSSQ